MDWYLYRTFLLKLRYYTSHYHNHHSITALLSVPNIYIVKLPWMYPDQRMFPWLPTGRRPPLLFFFQSNNILILPKTGLNVPLVVKEATPRLEVSLLDTYTPGN